MRGSKKRSNGNVIDIIYFQQIAMKKSEGKREEKVRGPEEANMHIF
jgi:hypothetical protein